MSVKRMFDRTIIDMDKFIDLPMSSKALYFLLGMEADDEGFVSPKKILRVHGGSDDDIKILIAKALVIPFESGVVVITDWYDNNWLDARRTKPTQHQKEKKALYLTRNKKYVLSNSEASIEEKSIEENKRKAFEVVEQTKEESENTKKIMNDIRKTLFSNSK